MEAYIQVATVLIAIVGNVAATKAFIGAMDKQVNRLSDSVDKLSDKVIELAIEVAVLKSAVGKINGTH